MLNVNQRLLVDVDTSEKLFDISGKLLFDMSKKLLFGISEKLLWNRTKLLLNGKLRVCKYKYKINPSLEINENRLNFFCQSVRRNAGASAKT